MNNASASSRPRSTVGRRIRRGLGVTTTLAVAAGLAAAAIMYLRRRGINPRTAGKRLGQRARSAAAALTGEARAAYGEVRQSVLRAMAQHDATPSKSVVHQAIREVIASLKRRRELTRAELLSLADQLKADWRSLQKESKQERER